MEGESNGHKPGEWIVDEVDYISATKKEHTVCEECGKIVAEETFALSSLINPEEKKFFLTPVDFAERLDYILTETGSSFRTVNFFPDEFGLTNCVVSDELGRVLIIWFRNTEYSDLNREYENLICLGDLCTSKDDDLFNSVLARVIMTCDPSIDFDRATAIVDEAYERYLSRNENPEDWDCVLCGTHNIGRECTHCGTGFDNRYYENGVSYKFSWSDNCNTAQCSVDKIN